MDLDVAGAISALTLTAWGALVGHWVGERRARSEVRRLHASTAAAEVLTSLRELQRLIRLHSCRMTLEASEVGRAVAAFGEVDDRHRHRLPSGMRHVRKSVLDAVGTVFGAVAFAHIRPDTGDHPLEEPHAMWAGYADEYIDHATAHLALWGDGMSDAGFSTFNDWLIETGRRGLPGTNSGNRIYKEIASSSPI